LFALGLHDRQIARMCEAAQYERKPCEEKVGKKRYDRRGPGGGRSTIRFRQPPPQRADRVNKSKVKFMTNVFPVLRRGGGRWLVLSLFFIAALVAAVPASFAQTGGGDFGPAAEPAKVAPAAGHLALDPPGPRDFILDRAGLITEPDAKKIKQIADKLLTDKAAPIIVVTIPSMSEYGGSGMRIETFARLLFDQWQIGPAKVGKTPWNYGILLLVSNGDRQARIELGAGWKRDKDAQAEQIMDEQIVPRFKQGDFSGGILAGVESLDKMARDLKLPGRQRSGKEYVVTGVLLGLGVFTVISLIRRGSSGWAWIFWAGVLGLVGAVLYQMATSNTRGGGGGGFSGGSFGGGFSGGGGASGSW
jgi:uncharacterized protein